MIAQPPNQRGRTDGLLLPGLDGSNPLGFLAALGVLRMLTLESSLGRVCLRWTLLGGGWIPAISCTLQTALDRDALLAALCRVLATDISEHPARLLEKLGTKDQKQRRDVFLEQFGQAAPDARTFADWLTALASDFAPAAAINQLQTTRRDNYYGNLTSVIKNTDIGHLRRSIFSPWDYADSLDNQSLHLDPSEDRRHAHQWNKPAGDPNRHKSGGMLGSNRLAIEAIPLFTSFPEDGALRTVGFTGNRRNNTRWTWPIWEASLDLSLVVTVLSLADLQAETMSPQQRHELRQRGLSAVFRSYRILVQKTPNFTPAQRIA